MDLRHLIFQVLYSLMIGTVLSFGLLREEQVGRKFYWIHGVGAVVIGLLAFLFIGLPSLSMQAKLFTSLSLLFAGLYSLRLTPNKAVDSVFYSLTALTTGLALKSTLAGEMLPLQLFNLSLSTLFLGMTMAAMLLGHWYLNQPKMSVDELKRLAWGYLVLVTVRFVLASYGMGKLLLPMTEAEIYKYLLASTTGIFITMRFFWGIIGPLALSYFIWGTVKIRSTQSATGILYVAVVFVLIGEIISQYLALASGIYL